MNEEEVKTAARGVGAETADETEESWKTHLAFAKNFLGSDAEYCRRNRLDPKVFRAYKKKYRRAERRASRAPAFVKVEKLERGAYVSAAEAHHFSREAALPDPRWTAEFISALVASSARARR